MKKIFFLCLLAIAVATTIFSCKKDDSGNGGTLSQPTIVLSETTPSQYVPCGDGGNQNQIMVTYNFDTKSETMITDLKFSVFGSISSIASVRIDGKDFPVNDGIIEASGLKIHLPKGGKKVLMYISYAQIGQSNPAGTVVSVSIVSVKYESIDESQVCVLFAEANSSPAMTLVTSVPHVVVSQPIHYFSTIQVGSVEVVDVSITGDEKGAIKIGEIAFSIKTENVWLGLSSNVNVFYNNSDGKNWVETANNIDSANKLLIQFKGDNEINHCASICYRIYLPIVNIGTGNSSIEVIMDPNSFIWDDFSEGSHAFNGNLLPDFPKNISVVSN